MSDPTTTTHLSLTAMIVSKLLSNFFPPSQGEVINPFRRTVNRLLRADHHLGGGETV